MNWTKQNQVRPNVEEFFPGLMQLASVLNINWDKLNDLFLKELVRRFKDSKGQSINIEIAIHDLIVQVRMGNLNAVGQVDFLNKLFYGLSNKLTDKEKRLIKPIIEGILINFNRRYLNFVGELAVLNNLLNSKSYLLRSVNQKCQMVST